MGKHKSSQIISSLSEDPAFKDKYQLMELIGQGCFGKVIKANHIKDSRICAIKLETFKNQLYKSILKNQIAILKQLQGKSGIPKLYSYGAWTQGLFLQMQLLNEDMNRQIKYSPSQIADLTVQLLKILREIHSQNIIHQDLKPHNIMRSKQNKLFIIDFGLAKNISFSHSSTTIKGFLGTPRYASIQAHNLLQQSKKDDLESLFYNIAFMFYHKLPWSKLSVANQQRIQKIKLLKIKHKQSLFNQMPFQFQKAFQYITTLSPLEEPNYPLLQGLFKRNKTLIVVNTIPKLQKSPVKRLSLNYSNFLQVPDQVLGSQQLIRCDQRQGNSCNLSTSSNINSSFIASDVILSHYLQIEEWQTQNCCQQTDEGVLPDRSKCLRNIRLKNPFG